MSHTIREALVFVRGAMFLLVWKVGGVLVWLAGALLFVLGSPTRPKEMLGDWYEQYDAAPDKVHWMEWAVALAGPLLFAALAVAFLMANAAVPFAVAAFLEWAPTHLWLIAAIVVLPLPTLVLGAFIYRGLGWRALAIPIACLGLLLLRDPVAYLLFAGITVVVLLYALEAHVRREDADTSSEVARARTLPVLASLRATALTVSVALALLVAVNAYVRSLIESESIQLQPYEDFVLQMHIGLAGVTPRWVILAVLAMAVLLALKRPQWRPVTFTVRGLTWIGRLKLVLAVTTAYTLFVPFSAAQYNGLWALTRREALIKSLADLATWRQKLVAEARVAAQLEQSRVVDRDAFVERLVPMLRQRQANRIEAWGEELGSTAPRLFGRFPDLPEPVTQRRQRAPERVIEVWLQQPASAPAPSPATLAAVTREASDAEVAYVEARSGLIRSIQMFSKLPVEIDPLLTPFVDALSSSAARAMLEGIVPPRLEDLPAARRWMAAATLRAALRGYAARETAWEWASQLRVSRPELDDLPTRPLDSAETLGAANRAALSRRGIPADLPDVPRSIQEPNALSRRGPGAVSQESPGTTMPRTAPPRRQAQPRPTTR